MYKYPENKMLQDNHVVLNPMKHSDYLELYKVVENCDDDLFHHMFFGPFRSKDEVKKYVDSQLSKKENIVFTIFSRRLNRLVGSCSIINIDPNSGGAEIGSVWYSKDAQSSEINTSVVLQILQYLFEDLSYRRVVWKCDNTNIPSKKAAEALGFRYEGLFRKHLIIKGRSRDTSWYSIIDNEWCEVKDLLKKRLVRKLNKS